MFTGARSLDRIFESSILNNRQVNSGKFRYIPHCITKIKLLCLINKNHISSFDIAKSITDIWTFEIMKKYLY